MAEMVMHTDIQLHVCSEYEVPVTNSSAVTSMIVTGTNMAAKERIYIGLLKLVVHMDVKYMYVPNLKLLSQIVQLLLAKTFLTKDSCQMVTISPSAQKLLVHMNSR